MVGSDVFHVHSEQALAEHAASWNDKLGVWKFDLNCQQKFEYLSFYN